MTAPTPQPGQHPPGYRGSIEPRDGNHLTGYGDCRCWCARCLAMVDQRKTCICPDCNRRCGCHHRAAAIGPEETTDA